MIVTKQFTFDEREVYDHLRINEIEFDEDTLDDVIAEEFDNLIDECSYTDVIVDISF